LLDFFIDFLNFIFVGKAVMVIMILTLFMLDK